MAVAFRKIILPRHHDKIATGQSVTVLSEVIDDSLAPHLINPTQTPLFSLFNPLGVTKVEDAIMTNISNGLYSYKYRVLSTEPLGIWTGNFTAINDGDVARIERISLFKTIKITNFADVSYLPMSNQSGTVYYITVDNAGQLVTHNQIPSFLIKDSVSLSESSVYWIVVNNALNQIRYVYIDVLGQFIVSAVQPSIGSGVVGSYVWTAENGRKYVITLDAVDQITITEV